MSALLDDVEDLKRKVRSLAIENQDRHDDVLKALKKQRRAATETPEPGLAEASEASQPYANHPVQQRVMARRMNGNAVLRER